MASRRSALYSLGLIPFSVPFLKKWAVEISKKEGSKMTTTPWCIYGQTSIATNALVNDPQPNVNGLVGEVTALPYVVPDGKRLTIQFCSLEALFGATIVPWIGEPPLLASKCLPTFGGAVGSGDGSQSAWGPRAMLTGVWMVSGMNFAIPAGKKLHFYISSGYQPASGQVFGWGFTGILEDVA